MHELGPSSGSGRWSEDACGILRNFLGLNGAGLEVKILGLLEGGRFAVNVRCVLSRCLPINDLNFTFLILLTG
jgi:hypothetical protein